MKKFVLSLLLMMILPLTGCVERFIAIQTTPPGAIVWLNDEEVGATPLQMAFTWYGEYDVVVRKPGYQTLKTSQKANAPIYQWVGFDFISECLLPFTFTDQHNWDFTLTEKTKPNSAELIQRAQAIRNETLNPPK